MNGKAENCREILKKSTFSLKVRVKNTSLTPLGYACINGDLETVKVLIEYGAKKGTAVGLDRMPPLLLAVENNHFQLVKYFVEDLKIRLISKDKFKRTPLIIAVMNGFIDITSYLLQRGAAWDLPDSSGNTPLQYACAYGWRECIEILLKAGADVNLQNSWKLSATNLAMLKNNFGCVKRMLQEENVDVNCKDDKGRTLLALCLLNVNKQSEEFV